MSPVEEAGCATVVFRYGTGEKGKGVGKDGRRRMKQPRGMHLCADGSLLVADFANYCVYRFAAGDVRGKVVAGEEGKQLPTIDPFKDIDRPLGAPEGEGRLMKQPVDVHMDATGGILVLDSHEGRIQRFDPSDADARAVSVVPTANIPMSKSNSDPGSLKLPRSFHLSDDGAIIVCDSWSHRVLRFPASGSVETDGKPQVVAGTPNSAGSGPEFFYFPSFVAFASNGDAFVADTNNHRVQRIRPGRDGALSTTTTVAGSLEPESGNALNRLCMPTGICVDPRSGALFIADRGNSRVLRFAPDCKADDFGEIVCGSDILYAPWGVCVGAEGDVYVSDERNACVLRLRLGATEPLPIVATPLDEEEEEEVTPPIVVESPPQLRDEEVAPPPTAPPVMDWNPDTSELD